MDISLKATDSELIEKFPMCNTSSDVAELLEINMKTLNYLLYRKSLSCQYKSFYLTKKSGGTRAICAPISTLKILQAKLNYIFSLVYKTKPSTHGFVTGKSILTNARVHLKKTHILNLDIKDFFPSINFGRVRGMFMASPYNLSREAATIFTQICCYENQLPQGAPTSPIVSNMICAKLDSQLQMLAKKYKCSYTRYADDITFSTTRKIFPKELAKVSLNGIVIGEPLEKIILNNGFQINELKTRLNDKTQRLEVTGVTVNKFPNVRRRYVRQIRAMLHAWEKYGFEGAQREHFEKYETQNRNPECELPNYGEIIRGKINFLRMIRGSKDKIFINLAERFNKLVEEKNKIRYPSPIQNITSALWVLESEESMTQGTGFMLDGVGLVTCYHVLGEPTYAFQSLNRKRYPVKVIKYDKDMDIAILEVDTEEKLNFTYLKAGDSSKLTFKSRITVAGFPNYTNGDSPYLVDGKVTLFRKSLKRFMVSAPIIAGNSGGPVLDFDNKVVGIAVTGADDFTHVSRMETEKYGVIPINEFMTNSIFADLILTAR